MRFRNVMLRQRLMKTTTVVLGLMAAVVLGGAPAEAATYPEKAKEENIFRKKRKGYRKKKGFLWGLFRKKNDCGCPSYK